MYLKNSSFNVLYIRSVEKTKTFYQAIGAEIQKVEDDKVVVSLGDFELHCILNTTEPFEAYNFTALAQDYGKGVIFYIETDDIQQTAKMITNTGGVIKAPIFENKWDCKELLFEDPDGYAFALYQSI